jgi:hypothetical protein
MLAAVLTFLFGSPRAALFVRVLGALGAMCPCAPEDAACPARHELASAAIVGASESDSDAALLLGTLAHETCARTMVQVRGPAVSWWQLEVHRRERAALLNDPFLAARRALGIARGGMGAYACGDGRRCPDAAAELRRYVERAGWALR